jgi:hypothetical protein
MFERMSDVVLKLVRELVHRQAIEQVGRFVHRHDDAEPARFGKRPHAFLRRARNDVLLPEFAARREENERHLEREVMFELGADMLIRALGVAGDLLEVRLDLRVVVDLEMVRRVDLPLEVVVADLVLAVIRHKVGLCRRPAGTAQDHQRRDQDDEERRRERPAGRANVHDLLLAGILLRVMSVPCHPRP